MKAIFADATELQIQSAEVIGGALRILAIGTSPEKLREIFSDPAKTKTIKIEERGQTLETYEGYTDYNHTEIYPGGIYGVVNNQIGKSTEERLSGMEQDIKDLQAGGIGVDKELLGATVFVARANAQALSDANALQAKVLYDTFDELVERNYTAKEQGFKFRDGDTLYKTAKDNVKFEVHFRPGLGTESLYTKIDEAHAGTIEDPIPAVANMEYEYGKYYTEDGVIYICKRGGIPNPEEMYGQKVTLQHPPSQLIGQYFEVVTR